MKLLGNNGAQGATAPVQQNWSCGVRVKFHCAAERVPLGAMPEMPTAIAHFTANGGLDYHAPSPAVEPVGLYARLAMHANTFQRRTS